MAVRIRSIGRGERSIVHSIVALPVYLYGHRSRRIGAVYGIVVGAGVKVDSTVEAGWILAEKPCQPWVVIPRTIEVQATVHLLTSRIKFRHSVSVTGHACPTQRLVRVPGLDGARFIGQRCRRSETRILTTCHVRRAHVARGT